MNREEARILHAVYSVRQIVGENLAFTPTELNWPANHSFREAENWRDENGKLKSLSTETDDYLASISATSAAAKRPLAYLAAKGLITFEEQGGMFRIAVTGEGADVARELSTFMGRLNILYKQHKDGVIWFLATVIVSLVTALVSTSGK